MPILLAGMLEVHVALPAGDGANADWHSMRVWHLGLEARGMAARCAVSCKTAAAKGRPVRGRAGMHAGRGLGPARAHVDVCGRRVRSEEECTMP